jgi:uncharacterized protein
MNIVWWTLAILLILTGIAGTILPALPGVPLIFGGVLVAAWIDGFQRISAFTVGLMAIGAILSIIIDYAASAFFAQKAGASRLGVIGAAVGTVAGIFSGLWGLLFMPLIGAAIGELIAHQDMLRAGKIGAATWIGLVVATVLKLAIAFMMIGVFVVALFI